MLDQIIQAIIKMTIAECLAIGIALGVGIIVVATIADLVLTNMFPDKKILKK